MLLEDESGWRSYYRDLLRGRDLRVFADGVEAIAAIDEERPSLIILDVMLVGPTGFAFLNELQSYPELSSIPIVIVSGVELSVAALLNYGVVAVFDKAVMLPKDLLAIAEKYDGEIEA